MSLYKAYLRCEPHEGGFRVLHNCNGSLNFCAERTVDEETARLIEYAIEEGKRQRSREIAALLSGG